MTDNTETQATVRDILHILFKHKMKILVLVLCIVPTVVKIVNSRPETYQATTKILVKFGRENIYKYSTDGRTASLFDSSKVERMNSQLVILRGHDLIKSVIEKIGVKNIYPFLLMQRKPENDPENFKTRAIEKAINIFRNSLVLKVVEKSNIIQISFVHTNPNTAAKAANTLVDLFLIRHLQLFQQPEQLQFFTKQVDELKVRLRDSERVLELFKKKHNVPAIDEQKSSLLRQISQFKSEIASNSVLINEYEAQLKKLSEQERSGETSERNLDAITNIRNKVTTLKLEEKELLSKYDESNILIVNIRNEIKAAEDLIQEEERTFFKKERLRIQNELDALNSKVAAQQKYLTLFEEEISEIDSLEIKLNELRRKVQINEVNYELYISRMEEARISNEMDAMKLTSISVVDVAVPPLKPRSTNKMVSIFLSVFMSLFFGIGLSFTIEILSHCFNNSYDVKKHLDMKVLASIPEYKKKRFWFF